MELASGRLGNNLLCIKRYMARCTFLQAKNCIARCPQRRMLCLVRLQPACVVSPESGIVACVCATPHACWSASGIQQRLCLKSCGLQTAALIAATCTEGAVLCHEFGKA